jgi:2,4-dienoyl-CoA reductase-like NADH-dependent reductase (Old Yellow Enzyme family)
MPPRAPHLPVLISLKDPPLSRTPKLFEPITWRGVTARNRIAVSPMCQYSAVDGVGGDWHIQTLGSKAMGGAGIVFTEATHVSDIGRITPFCLGLWNDTQASILKRLAAIIASGGAVPAIQIAHAGRKASTRAPWDGGTPITPDEGGWVPVAPSAIPFTDGSTMPEALSADAIGGIIAEFAATARLALEAGFRIAEIHAAHGYLLHNFLSPLSNRRNDSYGGDLAGRARALMEVIDAVRAVWPDDLPLFVRISCVDWADGGITLDDSVALARMLKARGDVDLIDCSSGGTVAKPAIPSLHPGYQVPFADRIRREAGIATGAVGMITAPELAAEIVANDRADIVLLARAILANPAWPVQAAKALGVEPFLPPQYQRATV